MGNSNIGFSLTFHARSTVTGFFHSVGVLWPRFYVWCFLNCSHFVLNCFLIFVGLLTLLMTECMYVILYLLFTRLFATGNNVTHYRYIQYLTRKY